MPIRPSTDAERVIGQITRGEVNASPEAARGIAQDIENSGGFWDHPRYQRPDIDPIPQQ